MSKFDKLKRILSKKPGIYNHEGLAATIGREKLGKEKFQKLAEAGKKNPEFYPKKSK